MVASIQDSTERGGNAEAIAERPKYAKPFSELAEIYQVTPRGLRKWICRGRLANDPPPLDNPALMPDWWTRHYRIRVPENLLLAAAVGLASIPTADEVQNAPSFATALDDARKNVVVCKTELAAARAVGNVHRIASCNRSYGDALDILVKCERLSFELRLKGGEFFSRADIDAEWLTSRSACDMCSKCSQRTLINVLPTRRGSCGIV